MSSQGIYIKTIASVQGELEKDLLGQAKKYLLKSRFSLGSGANKKQRNHALMTLSYICTENCELIDRINSQLKGCDTIAYVPEGKSVLEKILSKEYSHTNWEQASGGSTVDGECSDCVNWENKPW